MAKLRVSEVRELGLDDKRSWRRVTDANGHDLVVEDHDGGSIAVCDRCGDRVAYGGASLVEPSAPIDAGDVDRAVTDGDSGSSAEA